MDRVDKPQNFARVQLDDFPLKTLKLGWVDFHSLTIQLKCLGVQSNQFKKLAQCSHTFFFNFALSRFCNGLFLDFLVSLFESEFSWKTFNMKMNLQAEHIFI